MLISPPRKPFIDFRYQGKRYREFTGLKNTTASSRGLEKPGEKIEQKIVLGTFIYHAHFPNSAAGKRFAQQALQQQTLASLTT